MPEEKAPESAEAFLMSRGMRDAVVQLIRESTAKDLTSPKTSRPPSATYISVHHGISSPKNDDQDDEDGTLQFTEDDGDGKSTWTDGILWVWEADKRRRVDRNDPPTEQKIPWPVGLVKAESGHRCVWLVIGGEIVTIHYDCYQLDGWDADFGG